MGCRSRGGLSLVVGLAVAADLGDGSAEVGADVVGVHDSTVGLGSFGAPVVGVLVGRRRSPRLPCEQSLLCLAQFEPGLSEMCGRVRVLYVLVAAVLPRVVDDSARYCTRSLGMWVLPA